jgi:glycosyltransferase involved in cell wall biosynthesis
MADKKITALYICWWSLQDPLCQTQSLSYLRELTERGYRFSLITFEQGQYRLDAGRKKARQDELASAGIHWYPLTYHKRFPLLATSYDCLRAILVALFLILRYRIQMIHSRASIPSSIALAASSLCRVKFLYDADNRLSEEYADNGHWSRDGLAFRITAWVEATARKRADAVITLSETLREDFISEFGVRAPIEVIPCCVDLGVFFFDEQARRERRRQLQLADEEKLFVYVGKMGPRYLVQEMFEFFHLAKTRLGGARLLILSGDSPADFHRLAGAQGLRSEDYFVRHAGREEVREWLSAADAGLSLLRSAGCERGSSPVKIGEYLATRLPVLITPAIGDYSQWIAQNRLGVVVESLSEEGYIDATAKLLELWGDLSLGERCRKFAENNLSLKSVAALRYDRTYKRLVEQAAAPQE